MVSTRALVTGCAGFVGSHLTESLLADGYEVLGIDCFNANYARADKLRNLERAREWDSFEFVPIDLTRGDLLDLVAECETVFHLAAEPGVRTSWGTGFERYVRNNVTATHHLLEAVRAVRGRRVVYTSSSSVYGQAESLPTAEDVVLQPVSPYGVTKLAAEHLCGSSPMRSSSTSWRCVCSRSSVPASDPTWPSRPSAVRSWKGSRYTSTATAARRATLPTSAMSSRRHGRQRRPGLRGAVLNIGAGAPASLDDAIEALAELAGRQIPVTLEPRAPGDVRHTAADVREARERLAYEPQVSLREGLAAQWAWHSEALAEAR